jgi:glycosyltransferase involved in cell wall biosynthesis
MFLKSPDFIFVITAHKSLHLAQKCIESIECQKKSFKTKVIYVDDASQYEPSQKAALLTILKSVKGKAVFLPHRHYQIGSLSKVISNIGSPRSIICLIDGDDYLLPGALQRIAEAYSDPNIAMSYGNVLIDFRPYQNLQLEYFYDKKTVNTEYGSEVWKNRTFRQDGFRCFHLRTFRKWLWDLINPDHFIRASGEYFHASGDSSYVYPMLEMLGDPKHVAFIKEPIYVYRLHEGNVHNYDKQSQTDDLEYIRFKLPIYSLLDRDFLAKKLSLGE